MSSLVTTIWIAIGGTLLPILISAGRVRVRLARVPGRDWLFIVIALLVVPLRWRSSRCSASTRRAHQRHDLGADPLPYGVRPAPFAIFLLRNFFIGIPKDLLEAARIDGASEVRIFLRLILPLGLPAIASLIFQFLWTWNDLLVALVFGRDTQPLTVAIYRQLAQFGANIEIIAPATFVSLVIPLAVFFAFQRYFVEGLLAGSVK